jgi:hypothetical protein
MPTEDHRPGTTISPSDELATMDEAGETAGTTSAGSSHSRPVDTVGRIELEATVGKAGFFDLNRALSWLRDNARDVHVEISIAAVAPGEGFDRVKLRNGVVEPLEEGSAHVEVTLG